MEDLPDVIKSFLKEPSEIAESSKATKPSENEEDSFQMPNNDEEEESKETAEEKAERELDDRKSREALLTDEQRANILERCEKYKADGNEHFGNGRWKEAEDCYSLAIESSTLLMKSECAIYYSNRAAARIKRELWDSAIEDCNKAEELGAPNNKPLERRAYARLHSNDEKNLDGAVEDYKKLLAEKPTHKPYLEAKVLLEKKVAERNEKLKNEMFGTLKSLGNMCLKPFGLSTENFELVQNSEGGYSVNMKK
jgi:tetratricopeptide (TPR) repeat protein